MAYFGAINRKYRSLSVTKENRIITGSEYRTFCTLRFQSLEILTLPSKYILPIMKFLSHNLGIHMCNFTAHGINTSNKLQLHKLTPNLSLYQEGVHSMSIKIFNGLPEYIPVLVVDLYKPWKSTYLKKSFIYLKNSVMIKY